MCLVVKGFCGAVTLKVWQERARLLSLLKHSKAEEKLETVDAVKVEHSYKLGCRLLPRPATATQPVRRPRSSTWHYKSWQRLFGKLTDRVCKPYTPATRKGLIPSPVGASSGSSRRKQATNRAVVAVARNLAVLLHRIWTTQENYIPFYAEAA